MNKAKIHHYWRKVQIIRPSYFFAVAAVFAVISIVALRQNNLTMIRLRNAVYQADEQNGDVESALRDLRKYVYAHMNTDLAGGNNAIRPPVQLKFRYERLVAGEKARVADANARIYTDAQNYCEKQVPQGLSGRGRVPCIQDYVASHNLSEQPIDDSLYKFDFVSPSWSPDLAGWSLILALLAAGLGVIRFISERLIRAALD